MDTQEQAASVESVLAALSGDRDSEGAVAGITAGDGFRLDLSWMPDFPSRRSR